MGRQACNFLVELKEPAVQLDPSTVVQLMECFQLEVDHLWKLVSHQVE